MTKRTLTVYTRSIPMCTGCMKAKGALESEGIPFLEVDITHNPEVVEELGLMAIPTMIIREGDEVIDEFTGFTGTEVILDSLRGGGAID